MYCYSRSAKQSKRNSDRNRSIDSKHVELIAIATLKRSLNDDFYSPNVPYGHVSATVCILSPLTVPEA